MLRRKPLLQNSVDRELSFEFDADGFGTLTPES